MRLLGYERSQELVRIDVRRERSDDCSERGNVGHGCGASTSECARPQTLQRVSEVVVQPDRYAEGKVGQLDGRARGDSPSVPASAG